MILVLGVAKYFDNIISMLPLLVDNARKSNCSVESDCEPPTYSGLNINIDPLFTSGVNMYDDIEESLGGESVSHVSEANVAESESGITTEARHSLLILNASAYLCVCSHGFVTLNIIKKINNNMYQVSIFLFVDFSRCCY